MTGKNYNTSVNMANGAADVKYSIKSGDSLPEGLTLSEDGTISGKPTKAGVYTFTIVAEAEGIVGDEVTVRLYIAQGTSSGSNNNAPDNDVQDNQPSVDDGENPDVPNNSNSTGFNPVLIAVILGISVIILLIIKMFI